MWNLDSLQSEDAVEAGNEAAGETWHGNLCDRTESVSASSVDTAECTTKKIDSRIQIQHDIVVRMVKINGHRRKSLRLTNINSQNESSTEQESQAAAKVSIDNTAPVSCGLPTVGIVFLVYIRQKLGNRKKGSPVQSAETK